MDDDDVDEAIREVEEAFDQLALSLRKLPPEIAQPIWDQKAEEYRQFRAEVELVVNAGIATRAPLH
jgi:hypothetical protein